jgi:ankyrin repeat protein
VARGEMAALFAWCHGANGHVDALDGEFGMTLLMAAGLAGNESMVKEILDRGAKLNVRSRIQGATALMYAARANNPGVVRMLLSSGADPDIRDNSGGTAADWSMRVRASPIKRAVSAAGPPLNATDYPQYKVRLSPHSARLGAGSGTIKWDTAIFESKIRATRDS